MKRLSVLGLAALALALVTLGTLRRDPRTGAAAPSTAASTTAALLAPAQPAPDARLRSALPADSTLLDYKQGNYVGNGGTQFIALWTEPAQNASAESLHVGAVGPHVEAPWTLFWSAAIDTPAAEQATLSSVVLGGPDGFAVLAQRGIHGTQLVIYRWNGTTFVVVLDQATEGRDGFTLENFTGANRTDVVRSEPSDCYFAGDDAPYILTVYHWDGATFVDATDRFPAVMNRTDAVMQQMRNDQILIRNSTSTQKACFAGVEAYIAGMRGDQDGSASWCGWAAVYDPQWTAPAHWQVAVC